MLQLGSSALLSAVNAFHEPQECGAWGEGSRRGQQGAGSAQRRAAHPAVPAGHQLGCWAAPWSFMALRGQDLPPGTPVCLSWQLAQPRLAPPAAIFKAAGLHPKYSALYFWCKTIFLGGGCRDFFVCVMKFMGLEAGREGETSGHNWERGTRKSRESWWP